MTKKKLLIILIMAIIVIAGATILITNYNKDLELKEDEIFVNGVESGVNRITLLKGANSRYKVIVANVNASKSYEDDLTRYMLITGQIKNNEYDKIIQEREENYQITIKQLKKVLNLRIKYINGEKSKYEYLTELAEICSANDELKGLYNNDNI